MKRFRLSMCALLAFASIAVHAQTLPVAEDQAFTLTQPAAVKYSAGAAWTAKLFPAGTFKCDNKTFRDVAPGVGKRCDIAEIAPTQTCEPGQHTSGKGSKAAYDAEFELTGVKFAWAGWWCPVKKSWLPYIVACTGSGCSKAVFKAWEKSTKTVTQIVQTNGNTPLYSPELLAVWGTPDVVAQIAAQKPADKK